MHTSRMYKPGVCRSARRSPRLALWALVEALVPPSPPLPPHLHREVTNSQFQIHRHILQLVQNLTSWQGAPLVLNTRALQYVKCIPFCSMSPNCKGAAHSPTTCIFINCSKNESSGRESLSVVATDNRCKISGYERKTGDKNPVHKEE